MLTQIERFMAQQNIARRVLVEAQVRLLIHIARHRVVVSFARHERFQRFYSDFLIVFSCIPQRSEETSNSW